MRVRVQNNGRYSVLVIVVNLMAFPSNFRRGFIRSKVFSEVSHRFLLRTWPSGARILPVRSFFSF